MSKKFLTSLMDSSPLIEGNINALQITEATKAYSLEVCFVTVVQRMTSHNQDAMEGSSGKWLNPLSKSLNLEKKMLFVPTS
ncbi:hypothetical protein TNIN_198321 [Trichonephila inaurata madagascariensis]|uniref:Uncharacterized protein n=1 Tax=Trichonephila inaurata madagascariensis TaxID=2747483 RepID=A0A8X6X7Z7_9ARAC|nr:hypothetical protein TNIN_198321 [Trichonephila inaurata madagascariensis]